MVPTHTYGTTLRNFVGNIPKLWNLVGKIPTHDIKCRNNSYRCRNYFYMCKNNSYTCRNYSCTAKRWLAPCTTCRNFSYKLQQWGNISNKILQKFLIKLYTSRNHSSYTSIKNFFPALYLKIMISYLVWNVVSLPFCYNLMVSASNRLFCSQGFYRAEVSHLLQHSSPRTLQCSAAVAGRWTVFLCTLADIPFSA